FFKRDLADARRQTMTKAVEDAVANAQALATGARVKLNDTVAISGEPAYHYFGGQLTQTNATFVGGVGGEDTPIVAGDLEVTCRVSISCTY
ncbi:MAG TPA: SIMPL domain-containing protein, partial [Gemmataceae bacterium]|nr:SIMPL domain-containing protein [Gemmataceae bacterium]